MSMIAKRLLLIVVTVCGLSATDNLYDRFMGGGDTTTGECSGKIPSGQIRILYASYGTVTGCGYWKASPSEAWDIVRSFDAFESHPPDVKYKSSGHYPEYRQRVVSGGCPPNGKNLNCAD